MADPLHNNEETRDLLRAYLLDTLSDEERARIETLVAESDEHAALLEKERNAIAMLGTLPDPVVDDELVRKTLRAVERKDEKRAARRRARRYAWTGVAAACTLLIVAALGLPYFGRARESARMPSSQNNLKQLGLVMKMYANESKGERFPPVTSYEGLWIPDLRVLYPEYLTDPGILLNPSNENDSEALWDALQKQPPDWEAASRIVARNYNYLGIAVDNEEDFNTLFSDRMKVAKVDPETPIEVGDTTFYTLREGIERFLITDINNPAASAQVQSRVPIAFENIARARREGKRGCNVLFLDGHVEFIEFGEAFPVLDSVADALPEPS